MKFTKLEKLLPFGYILLIALGIIKESVFYYQLGINILSYSNIIDVLIGPISDLTAHPIILISVLLYILCSYYWFMYLGKNPNHKLAYKYLKLKPNSNLLSSEEFKIHVANKFLRFIIIGIMSFFLGIGLGNGYLTAQKVRNQTVDYNKNITFLSGESKKIFLIGLNSSHYFYVEKGNNNIQISPSNAIKSIEFQEN